MKTWGGLFDRIVAEDALRAAMLRAASGKRDRASVRSFLDRADHELGRLRRDFIKGTYEPGAFQQFRIRDPKPRTISCAPFRDRVAHHAICAVIGPVLETSMVEHSYACRIGKGAHRAVLQAWRNAGRHPWHAQMDVASFFDSVSHDRLAAEVLPVFRERRLRDLLERVLRHPVPGRPPGLGLPIGNLTSQWFANAFLSRLDHFILQEIRPGAYVRYMDDFVLWDRNCERLWQAVQEVRQALEERFVLRVKSNRIRLARCSEGLAFLGMRVYPGRIRLQGAKRRRLQRRVRRWNRDLERGAADEALAARHVLALAARPRYYGFRLLTGGGGEAGLGRQPGQPRRQLEQQRQELPLRESEQERAVQPEQQPGLPPREHQPQGHAVAGRVPSTESGAARGERTKTAAAGPPVSATAPKAARPFGRMVEKGGS